MKPRFLTINGVTRSLVGWSKQPGAANKTTISWRLKFFGWPPEKAVFEPSLRPRKEPESTKEPRQAPAPRVANPHPPTWGGFASYPIEALPLLRRVA